MAPIYCKFGSAELMAELLRSYADDEIDAQLLPAYKDDSGRQVFQLTTTQ